MEMILVDWTRMGKTFCVAGVVAEGPGWRTVRPLPATGARAGTGGRGGLSGVLDTLLYGPKSAPPQVRLSFRLGVF